MVIKMKYYNGCSLVDFFSFSLQTEVQKPMARVRFGEHRLENRKTSSTWMVDLRTLQTRKVLLLKVLSVKLKLLPLKDRSRQWWFNNSGSVILRLWKWCRQGKMPWSNQELTGKFYVSYSSSFGFQIHFGIR